MTLIDKEELIKWLKHNIEWYDKQALFWHMTESEEKYTVAASTMEYMIRNLERYPDLIWHEKTDREFLFGKRK